MQSPQLLRAINNCGKNSLFLFQRNCGKNSLFLFQWGFHFSLNFILITGHEKATILGNNMQSNSSPQALDYSGLIATPETTYGLALET